ncbi:MAG TPA: hypothetical protein VGI05_26095 [Streptosporangiaceae bacterium]
MPDCPNVKLLEERLAQVLGGRQDVTVSRQVIADQDEAARRGMHGSPTILVDGVDPFAGPGQSASVSCRLYRDGDSQLDRAPSVSQLRQALAAAVPCYITPGGGVAAAAVRLTWGRPADFRVAAAQLGPVNG